MTTISLIDGYIDEPTCLGVPPFISPYPRYIAGAIKKVSSDITIQYYTIDQIRQDSALKKSLNESDVLIVITGMVVPGKYLSGYPLHPKEIPRIFEQVQKPWKILVGPAARYGFGTSGGKKTSFSNEIHSYFDSIIIGDPEIVIYDWLQYNRDLNQIKTTLKRKNAEEIHFFAKKGAEIVTQHPYYPNRLIVEIETYRGCPRYLTGGCSFCIEPKKGIPDFRSIQSIHEEIEELYNKGIRHFRLGNQPCLFSYKSDDISRNEYPRPNPEAIEKLFSGIRIRAPHLKTLHIDNVNPGVVARYPKESEQIISTIIQHHTPGDVAAFGVESVDQEVIKQNNLKADPEMIRNAISLFNKLGGKRGRNGLPELLPGLNFICGLKGETKKTYEKNYTFLDSLVKQNLLIRRINLRQVLPIINTDMELIGDTIIKKHKKYFLKFKYKVKTTIEKPLLEKMVPKGTLLTNVYTELHKGHLTFARQIGSYPLLIGIPGKYPLKKEYTIRIIEHGYRSVTGVPYPLNINTCPRKTLESLDTIGKKRTIRILANRPYISKQDIKHIIDDPAIAEQLIPYITT